MTGVIYYEEGVLAIFIVDKVGKIFVNLDLRCFIAFLEPLVVHVEIVTVFENFL